MHICTSGIDRVNNISPDIFDDDLANLSTCFSVTRKHVLVVECLALLSGSTKAPGYYCNITESTEKLENN